MNIIIINHFMKTNKLNFAVFGLKQIMVLVTLCLLSTCFVACGSDDPEPEPTPAPAPEPEPEPETPAEPKSFSFVSTSTAANEWVYFSFEKGDSVAIDKANAAKDKTWDIAFQRFYIRTISGTAGEGHGGALDTNETAFDKVTKVPTEGFIVDTDIEMMTVMGKFETRPANTAFQVLEHPVWAWFDAPTGDMQWHYNKNVFVIKTADGKNYAKIIMQKYKSDDNKSGHITFDYVYPFK